MKIDISDVHGRDSSLLLAAEAVLRKRIAADPDSDQLHLRLAENLRQQGRLVAALEMYTSLLGSDSLDEIDQANVECHIAILSQKPRPAPGQGEQSSPFVVQADVLNRIERHGLNQLISSDGFDPATIGRGLDLEWRTAAVTGKLDADLADNFRDRLRAMLPAVTEQLGIAQFEADEIEVQLSAHHDGGFYKAHQDSGPGDAATRAVTFVYYFFAEPKQFSGGDLLLYDMDHARGTSSGRRFTRIVPQDNTLVLFSSDAYHQVTEVQLDSEAYQDGRFTINGWIHRIGD